MNNPFKDIISNETLPQGMKGKVMNDIELIKLSLEFTDLIGVKYPSALSEFLKLNHNS